MKKECCSCEWCKKLTDKYNREYYICMDCDSPCFLEETGICGDCTIDSEDEDDGKNEDIAYAIFNGLEDKS